MITIVIPSYNQQDFLSDAIESALNQTVKCEVIVVDDGSTDNSLEIAKRYEPRVKVVEQVNKGLASARNTGIMHAGNSWILPLDADDILLENCIERIQQRIDKGSADVVAPSFKEFGISNAIVELMPEPKLEDFRSGNRLGYCAAIKTDVLKSVGGYSPKMTWGAEDLHLWINLLTRGYKIETLHEVLWLYRTKSDSMWTETAKHKDEFLAQINKDFPEINLDF